PFRLSVRFGLTERSLHRLPQAEGHGSNPSRARRIRKVHLTSYVDGGLLHLTDDDVLSDRQDSRGETALTRVARTATAYARAENQAEKAREELHAAIRKAYASGEAANLIAHVAGVTRQRVHQIVKEGRRGQHRQKSS